MYFWEEDVVVVVVVAVVSVVGGVSDEHVVVGSGLVQRSMSLVHTDISRAVRVRRGGWEL